MLFFGGYILIGQDYSDTNSSSAIHLSNKTMHCNRIPDLPMPLELAQGVVLMNNSLFICGGFYSLDFNNACYLLNNNNNIWTKTTNLSEMR